MCSAHCLMCFIFVRSFMKISRTLSELWSRVHGRNGYVQYSKGDRNGYIQCSKGDNSISRQTRVMVHVFCKLSHSALHRCKVL